MPQQPNELFLRMPSSQPTVINPNEWEDYNADDWEDITPALPVQAPTPTQPQVQQPVQQQATLPPAEPSFLESAWNAISQPLWTKPQEAARDVATSMTDPNDKPGWLKSFGAGALEGAGNLVSGLTSPIDLATMALSGGSAGAARMGLGRAAKLLNIGARVSGAPVAAHGAATVADPDATIPERLFGALETVGGATAMAQPTPNIRIRNVPRATEVPPTPITTPRTEPSAIYLKNPTPDTIKQAMQKGYTMDKSNPIRADGAIRLIKSETPLDLPVLESEVGLNRPTPANARRQADEPFSAMGDAAIGNPPVNKGPTGIKRVAMEAFNFPRALMASIDFSAPLRQGLPLIHKKQFWTSLDDMFKAWGSEKAYDQIMTGILDEPLFRPRVNPRGKQIPSFAEEAGLKLTDLNSLTGREEHIMSTWAEKIPGVRRSNRAYTAFLNKLRADTFNSLIKNADVLTNAEANLPLARSLADFVNTASGRGSLGRLEQSAATLNSTLFSPRLMASRLKLLNPKYYWSAPPPVRKEAIKSLLAITAVGNTLGQLGRMAGAEVSMDPSNSDFGKIRFGNIRIDPWGGFQQYVVAANRLLNPLGPATGFEGNTPFTRGQMITSSGTGKEYDLWNPKGPYDPTHTDAALRFGRGKAHPVLGFAISLLSGQKEMTGDEMNFTTTNPFDNAVAQRFIPILIQDINEIVKEDPGLLPAAALIGMNAFGMPSQIYGDQ